MLPEVASGTYTGSGAAQTVTLGFKPKLLKLYNITDTDTIVDFLDTMTADTGIAITGAVATLASAGITLTATGFTLGTSAVSNENAKVFHYFAIGAN